VGLALAGALLEDLGTLGSATGWGGGERRGKTRHDGPSEEGAGEHRRLGNQNWGLGTVLHMEGLEVWVNLNRCSLGTSKGKQGETTWFPPTRR